MNHNKIYTYYYISHFILYHPFLTQIVIHYCYKLNFIIITDLVCLIPLILKTKNNNYNF